MGKKNRPGSQKKKARRNKPRNPDGSYRPAGPGERVYTSKRNKEIAVRVHGYRGPWPPAGPVELYLGNPGAGGWGIPGRDGWTGPDGWSKPACRRWRSEQEAFDREGVRYRNRTPSPKNGYLYLGHDPDKIESHPPDYETEDEFEEDDGEGEGEEEDQGEDEEEDDGDGEEEDEEEQGEEDDDEDNEDGGDDDKDAWDALEKEENEEPGSPDQDDRDGRQQQRRAPLRGPREPSKPPPAKPKAKAQGAKAQGAKDQGKADPRGPGRWRQPQVWGKKKQQFPPPSARATARRAPAEDQAAPSSGRAVARLTPAQEQANAEARGRRAVARLTPGPGDQAAVDPPAKKRRALSPTSRVGQLFQDTVRASAKSLADVHRRTYGEGKLTHPEALQIVDLFRESLDEEVARDR